jgi:hypothetical protein
MSIDDHTKPSTVERTDERPPIGEDFQTDLIRVGHVVQNAFEGVPDKPDWETDIAGLMAEFEERDLPPEDAIAAAWLFILGFAE